MGKHICPVCGKQSGRGTFKCVGCGVPERWVHPKCGNYTITHVQTAAKTGKEEGLRCNNCKQVKHVIYLHLV